MAEAGPSTPSPQPPTDAPFKVYRPSGVATPAPAPQLPDSYFEPTFSDLKAAQTQLASRTQNLYNAPLQLKATREASEKEKRDRWPNTTIRVRFSDRTQLERTFQSTEKIRSVYAFVRGSLREDMKPNKFILYQTPPKRDLKVSDPNVRDLTLVELQLAPSSVLMLRFEDDAYNGTSFLAPLAPEILAQAIDLPAPKTYDAPPTTQPEDTPPNKPKSTGDNMKKMPKWLKAGLKK